MRRVDGVVVSTFMSPGERACLDVLLEEGNAARIVWLIPMVMPEQIYAQWAGAFIEGRALWVSKYLSEPLAGAGHPQGEADPRPSRASCLECNAWVDKLCCG